MLLVRPMRLIGTTMVMPTTTMLPMLIGRVRLLR